MTLLALDILLGGMTFVLGVAALGWRARVLRFVRSRFEKVYREDGLSEAEIARRLPKAGAVVVIAVGFVVIGGAFVVVGLLSSR